MERARPRHPKDRTERFSTSYTADRSRRSSPSLLKYGRNETPRVMSLPVAGSDAGVLFVTAGRRAGETAG